MLKVICWKWKPQNPDFRSSFDAQSVNVLYSMVKRHYRRPFEMVCFTDDAANIDHHIRTIPVWDTYSDIVSPLGVSYPSCYRRLLAFRSDMEQIVGGRFVSMDLDCVITGDITPIWDRTEDFVIWHAETRNTPYNGSMWMMDPGAREQVYDQFDPLTSPALTRKLDLCGSDQAWIAHILGPDEATWGKEDGIYVWRKHLKNRMWRLPTDARIVFFQGKEDPWDQSAIDKAPWILEHYK